MRSILHPTLLDPRTGGPLVAIGIFRGRPIFPILGGAGDDGGGAGGAGGAGDGGAGDGGQGGGQGAGDKSVTMTQAELDRMIEGRLTRERTKYADYEQLQAAKAELDTLKLEGASEVDKAKATAKAEGIAEATTTLNRRVVNSEVRVQASGLKFHDPALAIGLIDTSKVKVSDEGDPDSAAIKVLLEDLAKKHPYLVKAEDDGKPRKPRPNNGQGNQSQDKPTGREAGQLEAERRFGKKS